MYRLLLKSLPGLTILLLLVGPKAVGGEAAMTGYDANAIAGDRHSHHRELLAQPSRYQRSQRDYPLPDVVLVDMHGREISLRSALGGEQPTILSFIFTSCSTICPVLTATLAQAERQLLDESVVPRIVAITIDPEFDTPERLRNYARSYRVGPGWNFITGDAKTIVTVQRAFDAYRGDKLNHIPVTFLRGNEGDDWLRLDGFTTAAQLVSEYRNVASN